MSKSRSIAKYKCSYGRTSLFLIWIFWWKIILFWKYLKEQQQNDTRLERQWETGRAWGQKDSPEKGALLWGPDAFSQGGGMVHLVAQYIAW